MALLLTDDFVFSKKGNIKEQINCSKVCFAIRWQISARCAERSRI